MHNVCNRKCKLISCEEHKQQNREILPCHLEYPLIGRAEEQPSQKNCKEKANNPTSTINNPIAFLLFTIFFLFFPSLFPFFPLCIALFYVFRVLSSSKTEKLQKIFAFHQHRRVFQEELTKWSATRKERTKKNYEIRILKCHQK